MAKKKTEKPKSKIDKLKEDKARLSDVCTDDIIDFPLLTEEEEAAMEVVDTHADIPHSNFWMKNVQRYWRFSEGYRLMQVLLYWLTAREENKYLKTFLYLVLPVAQDKGIVKKFPGKFVTEDNIKRICARWPQLAEMYKSAKGIQDAKIAEGGMSGKYNSSIVQLYLKTHNRDEWQETIKQEIVNKTQIVNVDPFEEDKKE